MDFKNFQKNCFRNRWTNMKERLKCIYRSANIYALSFFFLPARSVKTFKKLLNKAIFFTANPWFRKTQKTPTNQNQPP